ncbi:MAG: hypothetical protein ABIH35_00415 [Patescibacteria group bacterium]
MDATKIKQKIEELLSKKEKSIRNKNALTSFLKLIPPVDALWQVLVGSKEVIDVQRQKLTIEEILGFVIAIDQKLEGEKVASSNPKISILLENIKADENVVGLKGNTSSPEMKKMFENPVDIELKNIQAKNVVGAKFNVDAEMPIKRGLSVRSPFARVGLGPKVVLGKPTQRNNFLVGSSGLESAYILA